MTPLFASLLTLGAPLVCPMTGEAIPTGAKAYDWNGLRVRFCCPSCIEAFKKDPAQSIDAAGKKGWVAATAVFDPISGRKLTPQSANGGTSDVGGVRFAFQSSGNKAVFDSEPRKYGAVPSKSVGDCPVMKIALSNTYMATGYVDFEGVRYFACCDQCFPKLRANPAAHTKEFASQAGEPKIYEVPAVWQKMTGPGG